MKLTRRGRRYVVIDDLLPEAQLEQFRLALSGITFFPRVGEQLQRIFGLDPNAHFHSSSFEIKLPRLADKQLKSSVEGTGDAVDTCARSILENYHGACQQFDLQQLTLPATRECTFSGCLAIQIRGAGLRWHTDGGSRIFAFIYYAHPAWSSLWGGELAIVDAPLLDVDEPKSGAASVFTYDHGACLTVDRARYLLGASRIEFIWPKPNRLVVLEADTFHSIFELSDQTGNRPRMSLTGFVT